MMHLDVKIRIIFVVSKNLFDTRVAPDPRLQVTATWPCNVSAPLARVYKTEKYDLLTVAARSFFPGRNPTPNVNSNGGSAHRGRRDAYPEWSGCSRCYRESSHIPNPAPFRHPSANTTRSAISGLMLVCRLRQRTNNKPELV